MKNNALFPVSNVVSYLFVDKPYSRLNYFMLQTLIVTGITFNAILVHSSERRVQRFTKVGVQPDTGVVFNSSDRPEGVEMAAIGSEADRTSSRDNLNTVAVTRYTTIP